MFATEEETQKFRVDLKRPRTEFSLEEPSNDENNPMYRDESGWWHRSRREASVASASLFVGAPVTIASLVSPWLAKAFLPFTFAALWIGTIETLIHFVRYVRGNGTNGLGWAVAAMIAAIGGHAVMFLISCVRGLGASTSVLMCAFFSTAAVVSGVGIMLIADAWWYAITPSQMLFFLVTLQAMGLLLLLSVE
ncbi:MAG: hypothetical protein CML51_05690 [Rhodobacteraceae bacterium]|nr:hypothetical protein [Paracoccaceae bacterium]